MRSAEFTETMNCMVSPEQRHYLDTREATEKGVSRGSLIRKGLDMLMKAEPLPEPEVDRVITLP